MHSVLGEGTLGNSCRWILQQSTFQIYIKTAIFRNKCSLVSILTFSWMAPPSDGMKLRQVTDRLSKYPSLELVTGIFSEWMTSRIASNLYRSIWRVHAHAEYVSCTNIWGFKYGWNPRWNYGSRRWEGTTTVFLPLNNQIAAMHALLFMAQWITCLSGSSNPSSNRWMHYILERG